MRLIQLHLQLKMSGSTSKYTMLNGFSLWRICVPMLVLCHLYHGDVVGKYTTVTQQLIPQVNTTAVKLSIPLLDHLLAEMKSRFSKHQQTALFGLTIVPSVLVSIPPQNLSVKVQELGQLYESDLPSPDCLESELHSWQLKWRKHHHEHGEASLPSSATLTLNPVSSMFPNINTVLKLLCTLPVRSCSAERSFSELRRIKTPFWSAMTTARLSGLTLLYVHCDIAVDISASADEFTRRHQRQMQMAEILEDKDHDHSPFVLF